MAFTRLWKENEPAPSARAKTLPTILQQLKADIRERVAAMFGITDFTADPLKGTKIPLNGGAWAEIVIGSTGFRLIQTNGTTVIVTISKDGDLAVRNITAAGDVVINGQTNLNGVTNAIGVFSASQFRVALPDGTYINRLVGAGPVDSGGAGYRALRVGN